MFKKIMVPVDLGHIEKLERGLRVASDLALHYGAWITYVGVTAETPGPIGHNPAEYAAALDAFTTHEVSRHGHNADSVAFASHDPAVELNAVLLKAVEETNADLVVMASHIPGLADHLWPSHGAQLARRAAISVMLVR